MYIDTFALNVLALCYIHIYNGVQSSEFERLHFGKRVDILM